MNIKRYTKFNTTPYEAHMLVYDKIKMGSNVLDVGCATGYFARELQKKHCNVWGIDNNSHMLRTARKYCKDVVLEDLENVTNLPFSKSFFDYVLFMDVLEHLRNPEKILNKIKQYIAPRATIFISVPNVAFISIRFSMLFGKFNYRNEGLMDNSHVKFYTKDSLQQLIEKVGLAIDHWEVASGFSQIPKVGAFLNYVPKKMQYKITSYLPTLLGYQFIVTAHVQ